MDKDAKDIKRQLASLQKSVDNANAKLDDLNKMLDSIMVSRATTKTWQ